MRDKFDQYGHVFVMKTGPRSQVLCIDRPDDIIAILNSEAFMPAWPRAHPFMPDCYVVKAPLRILAIGECPQ